MSCDFKMVLAEIPPTEETPVPWQDSVEAASGLVFEAMQAARTIADAVNSECSAAEEATLSKYLDRQAAAAAEAAAAVQNMSGDGAFFKEKAAALEIMKAEEKKKAEEEAAAVAACGEGEAQAE